MASRTKTKRSSLGLSAKERATVEDYGASRGSIQREPKDSDLDLLHADQKAVHVAARRAVGIPYTAPMRGLSTSIAHMHYDLFENTQSLGNAWELFRDLDGIPAEAPRRNSVRRTSDNASGDVSGAPAEAALASDDRFEPNMLRAVCLTLLAQGMTGSLDQALMRPHFLGRVDPAFVGVQCVASWARGAVQVLHERLNKFAAALPRQIDADKDPHSGRS